MLFDWRPKVFLCHVPLLSDSERHGWFQKVLEVWASLGANVRILTPPPGVSPETFQVLRRQIADREGGKFYILADDDCLPLGDDFLAEGLSTLKAHPNFVQLTPLPSNENIVEWTPSPTIDNYTAYKDAEVFEHVSVGGIRFSRKMPFSLWPALVGTAPAYDGPHGEAIRQEGFRVGYMRNVRFLHLGAGKSTVWT